MTEPARQPAPEAQSGGILAIWTDIAPEIEAEFNEWYWREHLPERLAVPGFRSGRRYRALAGAPRSFAWYELDAVEILASPAYLERLNHPTEWTKRVMPGFRNTTRAVFRPVARVGSATGAVMLTVRLGPGGKDRLTSALLSALGREPGIVRAQLWQGAEVAAPATREAALRGSADQGADWAVTVEATDSDALAAATIHLGAAAAQGSVATYGFLCGLGAGS
jgi:hypothetical protein